MAVQHLLPYKTFSSPAIHLILNKHYNSRCIDEETESDR